MTIKAKAGKRDTCCSLKPSEMTGQQGEWMVNSYLLYLCTLNWAFGARIINMQLQSLWECWRGARWLCVCLVCVFVCQRVWLITHLCPLSELWPFSPFVRGVREETRGPSRHEITDYTLNASPRGLNGAQKSKIEGEWGGKRERERRKREKQTKGMNVNCKGAGESRPGRRESVSVWECEQETWKKKENEGKTGTECYCAFLSGSQNSFIAHSLTMCSRGLSVPMMTIANL